MLIVSNHDSNRPTQTTVVNTADFVGSQHNCSDRDGICNAGTRSMVECHPATRFGVRGTGLALEDSPCVCGLDGGLLTGVIRLSDAGPAKKPTGRSIHPWRLGRSGLRCVAGDEHRSGGDLASVNGLTRSINLHSAGFWPGSW
jgi:hypothetical protein